MVNDVDIRRRREVKRRERGAALGQGRVLATQTFPCDLRVLSDVRAFVEKWGKEVGLEEEQRYRLKLAASEACANAIEHPEERGDLTLWAWDRGDRFTVDVWNAGEFVVRSASHRTLADLTAASWHSPSMFDKSPFCA